MKPKQLATIFLLSGTFFALYVALFKLENGASGIWFSLQYVVGPWLVLDLIFVWLRWVRGIAIAAGLMLSMEFFVYFVIFVNPQSSTDAVAYLIKPFVQLLVFLPIGLLIGRVMDSHATKENQQENERKIPGSN